MSSKTRSKGKGKRSSLTFINSGLLFLHSILAGLLIYYMYTYHFLAFRHLNTIATVGLALIFLVALGSILGKKMQGFVTFLLLASSLLAGAGLYAFKSATDFSEKINSTATYSETEMTIWVKADNPAEDLSAISTVQVPLQNDGQNIDTFLSKVQYESGKELGKEEVDSYLTAYNNLQAGTSQAMVMNSAYESLLELEDPEYKSKIKAIHSYKISKQVETPAQESQNANVFNIYISGIDTYGSISTVSRSDVNILLTVNMDTHKILLTTTPRDSYVQIPDGGGNQYDKLTHSGIYGVETSMKTLENLYGTDIQYYARINFSSFMTLIDLLGGVEVYNDQAFTSRVGGYEFPVGNVTLNSQTALAFVRERYSLQGGDGDRGRNQLKVVSAIINKLASFDSLTNFTNILTGLQNSVQTNMDLETMMKIANNQLSSGSQFSVMSQDVTGTGSTGQLPSYAMPSASLYMMSLDPASLDTAKQKIQAVMEGQ